MPDFAAIGAVYTSLQIASDAAKAMVGLRDASMLQTKIIELQRAILEAQQSAFSAQNERTALIEQIESLERRVAEFEAWSTQKERYELKSLHRGSLAYAIKESVRGTEPPHYICANCFQENKKSILQGFTDYLGEHSLTCPRCKTKVIHSFERVSGGNFVVPHDYNPFD